MGTQTGIDAPCVNHGETAQGLAGSHSRPGFGQPASFSRPRPAERARKTSQSALQLAHDSFREPAPAGLRGGARGERHLVYMSREYAVDVHLEPGERDGAILHGELLSRSDGPLPEVPTFLLDGNEIAGYDRTDSLGGFELEATGAVQPRLCLLLDAERCIDLPIDLPSSIETAFDA